MSIYRTSDGDMLDAICKAHYGSVDHLPVVLDANAGLADYGPVLPLGLVIVLPDTSAEPVRPVVRLWGASDED